MDNALRPGDRVVCHEPGSWVDGETMTILNMKVTSSDGITGCLLQAEKGVTVVEA